MKETEIEKTFLKANILNQFPLEAFLQVYLADENYTHMDSLLSPQFTNIIRSGKVTAQGELMEEGIFNEEIPISKEKISKIFKAKYLIIAAKMNTTKAANGTQPYVLFKPEYKLKMKFGLRVDLKIKKEL
jgi:hypothetical protein